MNTRILLFLIGGLLAVRTQETNSNGGHHHHSSDHKDDIFIDDAETVEGSAAVSDLDEDASGIGPDDEDTFEGSGVISGDGPTKEIDPPTVFPITPAPTERVQLKTELPTTTKIVTQPTTTTTTEVTTHRNKIPEPPPVSPDRTPPPGPNEMDNNLGVLSRSPEERPSTSFFSQPGILAAIIGGAVVGLLCAILLVMFIVYRMRKKDEGSYVLDEPRRSPRNTSYHPANKDSKEFFA